MNIAVLPRLSSMGHELDTSPECFGELQSSIDLVGDTAALRQRMADDGRIYLSKFLDRDAVMDVREVVTNRLAE